MEKHFKVTTEPETQEMKIVFSVVVIVLVASIWFWDRWKKRDAPFVSNPACNAIWVKYLSQRLPPGEFTKHIQECTECRAKKAEFNARWQKGVRDVFNPPWWKFWRKRLRGIRMR